jgi:hypothetical protein
VAGPELVGLAVVRVVAPVVAVLVTELSEDGVKEGLNDP